MNKDFDNKIYKLLIKTKMNIIKNTDIAQMFGQNLSKINYIINYDNICVCFYIVSDKNKSDSEIEHFISNINIISNTIQKKCIGLIKTQLLKNIEELNSGKVKCGISSYPLAKNKMCINIEEGETLDWETLGDVVDEQSPADLAHFLRRTNSLFLWWD